MAIFWHNGTGIEFICSDGRSSDYQIFDKRIRDGKTRLSITKGEFRLYFGDPIPEYIKTAWNVFVQSRKEEYESVRARQIAKNSENAEYYLPWKEMDPIPSIP